MDLQVIQAWNQLKQERHVYGLIKRLILPVEACAYDYRSRLCLRLRVLQFSHYAWPSVQSLP